MFSDEPMDSVPHAVQFSCDLEHILLLCPTQFRGADRWVTRSTDGSSCLSPLLLHFKAALVLCRYPLTTDESPFRGFTPCANHAAADAAPRRRRGAGPRCGRRIVFLATEREESSWCGEILGGNGARTHAHDIRMVPGGDRKDVFVSCRQDRELPRRRMVGCARFKRDADRVEGEGKQF